MGNLFCNSPKQVAVSDDIQLKYSSSVLTIYEYIKNKYRFQTFTFKRMVNDIAKENPYTNIDERFIKKTLEILVEVKLLKYYKDGYYTIQMPSLSFEQEQQQQQQERSFLFRHL